MVRYNRLIGFFAIVIAFTILIATTTGGIVKNITLGLDLQGGFEVLYKASATDGQEITKEGLTETVAAIQRRISVLGVSENNVNIEGNDRIRVQLAGVTDQDKARDILGKPAKLTFRNINNEILLDGTDLVQGGAKLDYGKFGQPVVAIKLKDAQKFKDITTKYYKQPLIIYLDENMITDPNVESIITNGNAVISGQESAEAAKGLAKLLNAGALPLDLKEIQSQSVGASLGMEALDLTVKAGIIGSILILLFMIVYYRIPGLIAAFSLIVYVYLVLVVLWQLQVTLTLSGIAAFILGIGMAVDANIITYERIKDELRSGKSLLSSVRSGSQRALTTIFDANITTIIAAVVLYIFASSSITVTGFAISLIVNIVVSILTAVYGSRLLLNLFVRSNIVTSKRAYGVKEEEINEL